MALLLKAMALNQEARILLAITINFRGSIDKSCYNKYKIKGTDLGFFYRIHFFLK